MTQLPVVRRARAGGAAGGAGLAAAAGLLWCLAPAAPAAAAVTRPAAAAKTANAPGALPAAKGVYQTPAQALAQAERTGKRVAVTGATTPDSTLTANPDGTYTETESGGPVRAQVDGTWKDLNADLVRNSDGTYSPAVSSDPLTLSGGGAGPLAVMTSGTDSLALTAPMTLPAPVISGNTATYRSVLPGVSLIVTAQPSGGLSEVFEIASAQAAANPALKTLDFTVQAKGLTLKTASDGTISADSRNGQPVFSAPAPQMWDSTVTPALKAMAGKTGSPLSATAAQHAASTAQGPGTGARTARLGVTLSGDRLALTPAPSLAGGKVTYPEYIDPTWDAAGSSASSWAYVSGDFPGQEYYDTTSALQVGLEPGTGTTSYAFYTMPLPSQIKGTTINSATVYFPEIWSYSCTASPVDLYLTGPISSSTTYDSQPAWDSKLGSDDVAYGWSSSGTGGPSSCPYSAQDVAYSITSTIASDAKGTPPASLTFGLRAEDTSDNYGWKQFSDPGFSAIPENATITITYASAPAKPVLSTSPASDCATGTTVLGDGDVNLNAAVSDPDGGTLSVAYAGYADGDTSDTFASNPTMTVSAGSGTTAQLELKAADLQTAVNKYGSSGQVTIDWSATVSTGLSGVPTATASCAFIFSTAAPGAPTVTDSGGNPGCDTESYTDGTPATFTVSASAGTVASTVPVSYVYQLNGGDTVTVAAGASSPYSAAISVTPTRITNVLDVTATGTGGNVGQTFSCVINAAAPGPAVDQDLTGDGIPDLLTVGNGTTGTAPGLWLADGQGNDGRFDGTVATTAADIAPLGPQDVGNPASWDGMQAITGQFGGPGFNDVEAYQPGSQNVYILPGQGDGSVTVSQSQNLLDVFSDTSDTSGNTNYPLQLVSAYDLYAVSNDLTAEPYPDQIGVFDDPDSSVGAYLAYFANSDSDSSFDSGNGAPFELTNPSPDGTMDWTDWTITTDSDTRSGSSYIDMWLRDSSTGALYLWELTGLTVLSNGGFDFTTFQEVNPSATLTYTQTEVSASWDQGTALNTFQATDINGVPGVLTVTSAGQVQSWAWNGTALTQANATGSAQSLITADHTYLLDQDTTGGGSTITTAPDQPGADDTENDLSGRSGATWNTGDSLFPVDAEFNGTSGFLSTGFGIGDITPDHSFTVSAWVKPTALGGTVFSQNGAVYSVIAVSTTTSGQWSVEMDGTDTSDSDYTSAAGGTVQAGTWADITLTYDTVGGADLLKLYVNGTEVLAFSDTTPPTDSTGRFDLGDTQSDGGSVDYFTGEMADVQVWDTLAVPVQPQTPGSVYVPLTSPVRIMDTRSGTQIGPVTGPVAAGSTTAVPIEGNTTNGADIPASGVTAVAVAITVASPAHSGFLTAYPAGAPLPVSSTLNFPSTGIAVTNDAIVPVGPDGDIAIHNNSAGTTQIIVDVYGYFTTSTNAPNASTYTPLTAPTRILDTSTGIGAPEGEIASHATFTLPIAGNTTNGADIPASGVTAVAITITASPPASSDQGYLYTYADGNKGSVVSSLTYNGEPQSGTVLVPVGADGDIDIYNSSSTAVYLDGDVSGYFTSGTAGQYYHPLDSTRLIDTRQSSALSGGDVITIPVPAAVTADNPTLVLNVTAADGDGYGWLDAYPSSLSKAPEANVINDSGDETVADLALVNTATANAFSVGDGEPAADTIEVVVDANGYFD